MFFTDEVRSEALKTSTVCAIVEGDPPVACMTVLLAVGLCLCLVKPRGRFDRRRAELNGQALARPTDSGTRSPGNAFLIRPPRTGMFWSRTGDRR